jgi:hypothetical protein
MNWLRSEDPKQEKVTIVLLVPDTKCTTSIFGSLNAEQY